MNNLKISQCLTNFVEYNGVDDDAENNYRPNEGDSNDK